MKSFVKNTLMVYGFILLVLVGAAILISPAILAIVFKCIYGNDLYWLFLLGFLVTIPLGFSMVVALFMDN